MPELANYFNLVRRVDEICSNITKRFADAIACKAGCSGCCRHLTLFPVEAAALSMALSRPDTSLPEAAEMQLDTPCPLLDDDRCIAYDARPIICRTHGLPLLVELEGKKRVDYCPENFRGLDSLPGEAVLNLDLINRTLVTINARYMEEAAASPFREKDRYSIADIVRAAIASAS